MTCLSAGRSFSQQAELRFGNDRTPNYHSDDAAEISYPDGQRPYSDSLLLLRAERLALLPAATLTRAETLAGVAGLTAADSGEVQETVLHVPLAVVRLVRDALHEVVHVGRGVEVRGAYLSKLVENAVTGLPPVLAKLLLQLLCLLLLSHYVVSPL
ncbi:hypothetical protein FRACA_10127 [Frankia canadensis]|uniref:Uncharacterized protein n=1 Tax=Frankia canadensis TaxID=1836972 RepID=A0A2I2KI69_9ACTN|nr:hypothetical protein FRACA_10127 [Frankia canadensis]SOU52658.1 hypothetical protein FRACA_10127 [Frankia canadensis]